MFRYMVRLIRRVTQCILHNPSSVEGQFQCEDGHCHRHSLNRDFTRRLLILISCMSEHMEVCVSKFITKNHGHSTDAVFQLTVTSQVQCLCLFPADNGAV